MRTVGTAGLAALLLTSPALAWESDPITRDAHRCLDLASRMDAAKKTGRKAHPRKTAR